MQELSFLLFCLYVVGPLGLLGFGFSPALTFFS